MLHTTTAAAILLGLATRAWANNDDPWVSAITAMT